jgi:hypothetical protein
MSQIVNKFIKNTTVDLTAKVTGTLPIANGGTGQTTQTAAFDALSPTTTKGDTLVYSGTHNVRLPVGGDNKVIMADSTDSNNLGWRTPAIQKNYITNPGFDSNTTTGWSLGHATVTSGLPTGTPTFGSGASGNLSISVGGGLRDQYSLSYASSAASTAGDFVATNAITLDFEDAAKVITFKFAYNASVNPGNANWSGTSSNSFGVAIYDVTNSAWIIPAGVYGMTTNSGVGICTGTFQSNSSSSNQYRLVIYNANATSGAATVLFDDFYLGPQTILMGSPITDWQTYTPSSTQGFGTTTSNTFLWRRTGGNLDVIAHFTAGTVAASEARISFPSGLTSSSSIASTAMIVGHLTSTTNTVNTYEVLAEPSVTYFNFGQNAAGQAGLAPANGNSIFATSQVISFFASVPIQGWSSNVQMSNDTDTRVVAGAAVGVTATITSSYSNLQWATINNDTHGAFNSSTPTTYTIPVTGYYDFSGQVFVSATTIAAGNNFTIGLYNNTSSTTIYETEYVYEGTNTTNTSIPFNYEQVFLSAGTAIIVRILSNTTSPVITASTTKNFLSVGRRSGPSVIAASETVAASYYVSANFAAGTTTPINFDTKIRDTHGAVTTSPTAWKFTAPISGTYNIGGVMAITAGSATNVFAYKNGSSASILGFFNANYAAMTPNMDIQLNAGDYIDIRPTSSVTFDGGNYASTGANSSVICIKRVGN